MKHIHLYILLFTTLLLSCSKNPETFIPHLTGYWEIDEVTLADGSKRDFNYNEMIDYISVSDSLVGFRKKLKPNFDGSFTTSEDAENLKIIIENDSLFIHYKTPYAKWREAVLNANDKQLLILNNQNVLYLYKRYEPLKLE
jgi:hypothetical protein